MSVRRVRTAWDLPTESLRCTAAGRHLGFLQNDARVSAESIGGWGDGVDARQVTYSCHCGRTLTETIDWSKGSNGDRLTRSSGDYDGGVLPETPVTQRQARLILLRRQTEVAAGVPRVGRGA